MWILIGVTEIRKIFIRSCVVKRKNKYKIFTINYEEKQRYPAKNLCADFDKAKMTAVIKFLT